MNTVVPMPNPSRSEFQMPSENGQHLEHQEHQSQPPTAQEAFLGVTGKWRNWAGFGIAGFVCGLLSWITMHELPATRQEFNKLQQEQQIRHQQDIQAERKAAREDQAASRAHGDKAVGEITAAIREQTKAITEQQRELIGLHKRQMMVGPQTDIPE